MKKFKKDDVIRLKADDDKRRTYKVLVGTNDEHRMPQAIRNDEYAGPWPMTFVLGRPEQYELVKRPSKKDKEIATLQLSLKETQEALKGAQARATEAQEAVDAQLLEAGLVRIDLLRANVLDNAWSSDPNGVRAELVIDVRKDAVHAAVRRIAR